MSAKTQFQLNAADLELLLALVRGGTLAQAGERLGVDASTAFRGLQRIERGLGSALFERTRAGLRPGDAALQLAAQAEQVEAAVEAARELAQPAAKSGPAQVAGTVRISTTDSLLHGLLAPALKPLRTAQPLLGFELRTGNELVNLARRDADIALRATKRPPQHLVGRSLGPLRVALYARKGSVKGFDGARLGQLDWIAPDDALPEHPTVLWRKRHWPKLQPRWRVDSIVAVAELAALGLGVGLLPLFLAEGRRELQRLGDPIDEAASELWLLTHPEVRHLRRIALVYAHLAEAVVLR